ncbi:VOC family protein [Microbispora sp. NPDC049125]|uniref:VOC family protein n=1 Tax=Microbispora sp. NPDC049125 TaxID=3154929 RepID=UPI0034670143
MNVISSAVSLTVADPAASSEFLTSHLGFREILVDADFITLGRDDAAVELVLTRHDPEKDPPGLGPTGVIVSFAITGIAAEYERLRDEGAEIGVPLHRDTWGEWVLRLTDPNGVVIELVEWEPPGGIQPPAD